MALQTRTVLVADDEDHIRQLIRLYLVNEGFGVTEAKSGKEALDSWQKDNPDLVVLDIMMPEMDGWEVLKQIRKQKNTPVIMLTAKDAEVDKVLGLELGADDYVTKPFSPRELVSRVKAVLRRSDSASGAVYRTEHDEAAQASQPPGGPAASAHPGESVSYPGLRIDRAAREVHVGDQILSLPPKEFDLLWILASNPNRVFTREYLLETVWEYTYFGDIRTVDVHVRRIRQKIEKDPDNPTYIKTAWGVGYKFEYHPG
ncbi:MAG: response regulator transcription factor [Bacillota bacterium]